VTKPTNEKEMGVIRRGALWHGLIGGLALGLLVGTTFGREWKWKVHDKSRPLPPKVAAGETAAQAPSDAIVLFDGTNLDEWVGKNGGKPGWRIEDGAMTVVRKTGNIYTKRKFGDCQLHVEWRTPRGHDQKGSNSGVFIQDRYELQVMDSYENKTYADGMAAAVYGQTPPLVNASRPPGQWQSYDIVFHAPRFEDGKVVRPARVTVLHNGVLVQDHTEIYGGTVWRKRPKYSPHPLRMPIRLQDHGDPVQYRNIWVRELPMEEESKEKK
jgi:hypothetical protein